jgi:hypothetical protein
MYLIPKLGKKPKWRPKRIAIKSLFKAHRAYPFKSYLRKYTDVQVSWASRSLVAFTGSSMRTRKMNDRRQACAVDTDTKLPESQA